MSKNLVVLRLAHLSRQELAAVLDLKANGHVCIADDRRDIYDCLGHVDSGGGLWFDEGCYEVANDWDVDRWARLMCRFEVTLIGAICELIETPERYAVNPIWIRLYGDDYKKLCAIVRD